MSREECSVCGSWPSMGTWKLQVGIAEAWCTVPLLLEIGWCTAGDFSKEVYVHS